MVDRQNSYIVRPVTASKSWVCREGHTSGPCRWLFSAARPIGDVKSLKALNRYNVVKAPAMGRLAPALVRDSYDCHLLNGWMSQQGAIDFHRRNIFIGRGSIGQPARICGDAIDG